MKVSFVVPLFNCLEITQTCIETLRATLPRDLSYEIILVDDGSTDGTRAWLATLGAPFKVVLNERNLGYAGANNRGAQKATGEFLALANNDLRFDVPWIEPMLGCFSKKQDAGLVGNVQYNLRTLEWDHTGIYFNLKGKPEHDHSLPSRFSLCLKPYKSVDAVTGACMLVRRQTYVELGGFDEGYLNGCEDVDLCLRGRQKGLMSYVALRSVVAHHISASPGRKHRDEQNTRRLVSIWRGTIARLAARNWCRHYLDLHRLNPSRGDPVLLRKCRRHLRNISPNPPGVSVQAIEAALAVEEERWQQLLGAP
ncbi:MAG TPA: glycosyltransferase family 2 protein [Opitutaceae bacterium]|nr:glycosyltransferase family 2 protein [Opitutaceae bacterium]